MQIILINMLVCADLVIWSLNLAIQLGFTII